MRERKSRGEKGYINNFEEFEFFNFSKNTLAGLFLITCKFLVGYFETVNGLIHFQTCNLINTFKSK